MSDRVWLRCQACGALLVTTSYFYPRRRCRCGGSFTYEHDWPLMVVMRDE